MNEKVGDQLIKMPSKSTLRAFYLSSILLCQMHINILHFV